MTDAGLLPQGRECPDCNGRLEQIKLIGEGWMNPISKIVLQSELQYYAGAEAERGGFSGTYQPSGEVETFRCTDCGRIFLYGTPKA